MEALETTTMDSAGPTTPGLEACLAPIEQARGLPNALYTDPAWLAAERAHLFDAGWTSIGLAADVAAPGSVHPLTFLGRPLLMVRDHAGEVRVFHNVCRHRGMILVDRPGRLKGPIRCPYHSWCYGLDGRLRQAPHVGGPGRHHSHGFDAAGIGLAEIRATVWMGVVFINMDGRAPPFAEAEIVERWRDFAAAPLHPGGAETRLDYELHANWKLAVENYCEAYHLPWVHPGLNSYSRLEDHYAIAVEDRFAGQGSLRYDPPLDSSGRRFPEHAPLSEAWRSGAEYIALFPNTLLGLHRDHLFVIIVTPTAVDRCHERVEILFFSEAATGEAMAGLRGRLRQAWAEVFAEDVPVVEGMQRGRASPGFDGGVFSPVMDGPTHTFHRWAARRLLGDGGDARTRSVESATSG